MDYNTLIGAGTTAGSLANWANSTAVTGAAPTILEEAQGWVYSRLRHWQMITSTSGTATASTTALTLPTNFLEDKKLRITGTAAMTLTRKPLQNVIDAQTYDSTGARVANAPSYYANDGSNLQFDTMTDQAYPFTLWFYGRPALLGTASASSTNFLTGKYPRLLRCAAMIGVCEFMKDNGAGAYDKSYWETEAEKELSNAQRESDMHQRSAEVEAIIE
jgi:hypothetical protein